MFFFFHLLTGIILGFIISDLLKDRRWFIPCTLGAILPDLIDKPVGYLFFPAAIGSGRIYAHTLLITVIIIALGIVFWKIWKEPGILGLGVGILSHQALDLMWRYPSDWYHPFFGPFKGGMKDDYLWTLFLQELKNPFELVLVLLLLAIFVTILFRHRIADKIIRNHEIVSLIAIAIAILLCIIAGLAVGLGLANQTLKNIGWTLPEELIIGGVVIALSAYLVWRWQKLMCE